MTLHIQIENGQPINHPAFDDNLIQAFGVIPDNWQPFNRIEQPIIGVYEVYDGVTYEWFDRVVKDVHHVRPMTEFEKAEKITQLSNIEIPEGWVFNEILGNWEQTK